MSKIRVLIADDHAILREGVRALLASQADIEVVGDAVDGKDAIEKVAQLDPDVVLMDIAMKGLDGLGATAKIIAGFPDARVIILTEYDDPDLRELARRAGACDYVLKEDLSRLPALLQGEPRILSTPGHQDQPRIPLRH